MIIQGLLPPAFDLAYAAYWHARRCCFPLGRTKYQAALNTYWAPPEFSVAPRYAQLLSLAFVCLMYATGIPLLYWILAISVLFRSGVSAHGEEKRGNVGRVVVS